MEAKMKRLRMYVPTHTAKQYVEAENLLRALSHAYVGFTRYAAEGVWFSKAWNKAMTERVVVVEVLTDDPRDAVRALRQYGEQAKEETVLWTVEDVEAHFETVAARDEKEVA